MINEILLRNGFEILENGCCYTDLHRVERAMREYTREKDKEIERLKGLIFTAWQQSQDNVCIEHGMYDKDEFEEGEMPVYKHFRQFKVDHNL